MSAETIYAISALLGYFVGSIPFGLILTRMAGYGDIRKIGSGNIGATNVLRTGNKGLALLTVLCDAFKAGIAAFVAGHIFAGENGVTASLVAGAFGVLGHNFPVWLKFKGGKGVASTFGFILMTCWPVALIALAIWLIMAFTFKYSSLSALTASALVPFVSYFLAPSIEYTYVYTAIVILVIVRHHANIKRLLKGEESKIKLKKEEKSE
ncbi:MAG: glycerol-3-phosphate 1-O-acyltransferase PlsY [Alphaproteobacteria bacterium]|nr:glycerol-3-phosphate 1-O-acyltransferase PlsY [Alphaproteobacteria bacterium]